jgi:hypothetical protein
MKGSSKKSLFLKKELGTFKKRVKKELEVPIYNSTKEE